MILKLSHKNLDTWKKSLDLVELINVLTKKLPTDEKYIIIPQLKRAAISVASNIVEGYARSSKLETRRFLDISIASLVEIDTQLEICIRLNYVNEDGLVKLDVLINHLFAMLTKLKKSIRIN